MPFENLEACPVEYNTANIMVGHLGEEGFASRWNIYSTG